MYKGGYNKEGVGSVLQRYCLEESSSLSSSATTETEVLEDIILLDLMFIVRVGDGVGLSRKMMMN